MRGTMASLVAVALLCSLIAPSRVLADGPEAGLSLGAAIPYSSYRRTVDGNVGGLLGLLGGYQFSIRDDLAISLVAEPQFAFFPTNECCGSSEDDTASMFIGSAGPKVTIFGGPFETSFTVQGAYYRDMSGPVSDDGPGVNGGLDLRYRFGQGTSFGLFGRYHWADMDQSPSSDGPRRLVTAGLSFRHVFEPAPAIAEPPPPPPPPPPAPKRRIVLRGVTFEFDKATIRPDAAPILDEAVRTLSEEGEIVITVEGHTDAIGTEVYNQSLSERRAGAVADYLAAGGIVRDRMTVQGFGESKPVASNTTDDGRAQNRRVELRIIDR